MDNSKFISPCKPYINYETFYAPITHNQVAKLVGSIQIVGPPLLISLIK
jgi:hypothetical protein